MKVVVRHFSRNLCSKSCSSVFSLQTGSDLLPNFASFVVKDTGFYNGSLLFAACLDCAAASAATRPASAAWSPSAAAVNLYAQNHHGNVWPARHSSLFCRWP